MDAMGRRLEMNGARKQPTIMVVDDIPDNLTVLEKMLRESGYRVVAFPRGDLALKAAARKPPDLILLDIMMPGMDGFAVCERLKADEGDPGALHQRIVRDKGQAEGLFRGRRGLCDQTLSIRRGPRSG